ncbi:diphthamide biosynthesis protein [Myriangium duriaei CBS 260.36]|uniref:2-(3-amino-3-carboxypropyl)histidine synthase subunit 2 n=1 Tax=Myriangium duriaei CBS 260.36 TaxID=1168546 RepID=A0A9P4IZW9_9PEZI|nr:diphthamide biosynthesis protein [Myriangium duriaei CBS 260.36]
MTALDAAPVLSTPDEHIFQEPTTTTNSAAFAELAQDELCSIYEIDRTTSEILSGGWTKIALQFPDDMLRDAPRVFESLRDSLATHDHSHGPSNGNIESIDERLEKTSLQTENLASDHQARNWKLTILADTSYGACCVDEIAAEHVDAEVVVHYGRTCLSPTARLPVIYVFTLKPLNVESVVAAFEQTYADRDSKVILLADVPWNGHVDAVAGRLKAVGYTNLFTPSIIHNPASLIPNRALPTEAEADATILKDYSVFHISDPPTSLLLNLGSRVSSIHIYPTDGSSTPTAQAVDRSTAQALRRRYALVTKLSTVPIFGILINTLSVKNYMTVLQHVKDLITAAGKKYYTFVVGKVNAAKVANFSEVGGWVVIGCWESSLIESKDFWKPIITPFELKLALTDEKDRIWTGEWNSNFQALLDSKDTSAPTGGTDETEEMDSDEDEPPVFDFRTGKYVSQSRPMGRPKRNASNLQSRTPATTAADTSLIKRATGDLAHVGGEVSPAAEFLRSHRTWRGLGSDYEIAYQHDDKGKVVGAPVEEGRGGIARGYAVGNDDRT